MIAWIKRQWHVLTAWILTAVLGTGIVILNNGHKVVPINRVSLESALVAGNIDTTNYKIQGKPIRLDVMPMQSGDNGLQIIMRNDSVWSIKKFSTDKKCVIASKLTPGME